MTCHVVMSAGHPGDNFLMETAKEFARDHAISHATLQIEIDENNACALTPDNVV